MAVCLSVWRQQESLWVFQNLLGGTEAHCAAVLRSGLPVMDMLLATLCTAGGAGKNLPYLSVSALLSLSIYLSLFSLYLSPPPSLSLFSLCIYPSYSLTLSFSLSSILSPFYRRFLGFYAYNTDCVCLSTGWLCLDHFDIQRGAALAINHAARWVAVCVCVTVCM